MLPFSSFADIFSIALRSMTVYAFIILALRLFGKKELSQLSIVDLVFILLLSNSVQNAMVGDNSTLVGGLTAATALFLVNVTLKNILFKSKTARRAFEGDPLMLIYEGKVIQEHLDKAKVSPEELLESIREHGVEKIAQVDLAILEVDGNISVVSDNFKRRTRKRRAHKSLSLGN